MCTQTGPAGEELHSSEFYIVRKLKIVFSMTVYRLYQGILHFQNVVLLHSTTFPAQILTMRTGSIHLIRVTQYISQTSAVPSFFNLIADTSPETEQGLQLRFLFLNVIH
jgi:hypothetical protein